MTLQRTVQILVVEDSPGDRVLIQQLFRCRTLKCEFAFLGDGAEALEYLYRRGQHANATRPDLILLDLNLPKVDGREVLRSIKADDALKHIPVIVFSTSRSQDDIAQVYGLHGNCYLVKPHDLDEFQKVMEKVESFWVNTTELCENKACA